MEKKVKNRYAELVAAERQFPYFVLREENIHLTSEYKEELLKILKYYEAYEKGATFYTEGSGGKYTPSDISYKTSKTLIDKQSRFMFSQMPDVNITGTVEESAKDETIEAYRKVINKVFEANNIGPKILKASKDCFIGKRVACLVDMSDRTGIAIHFYASNEFYYETDYSTGEIKRFISFENVSGTRVYGNRLFVVNRYSIENNKVYVSSVLYNGNGETIEEYVSKHETDLKHIPVVIITNEGLTKDRKGVSDMDDSIEYEKGYSRLANADIDAGRKGMNPIKYLVDMNKETTKDLPYGPGALWDLERDLTLDNSSPMIGQISPAMNHTEAVSASLNRLRAAMYESMDVPDISKEGLLSGITSFKALKALYYPLIIRCNEKLMVWKPALEKIVRNVIELSCLNEAVTKELYFVSSFKQIEYNVEIVENYALLDDEVEEKQSDMEEISVKARSRYSYLKKWRGGELKTEEAIEEELLRIAEEENMMDTLSMNTQVQNRIQNKTEQEEINNLMEEAETNETNAVE